MRHSASISAIVPIYNERDNLPEAVLEIDRFLAAPLADAAGYERIDLASNGAPITKELAHATLSAIASGR